MEETECSHRDRLLLARSEELQREYENLVRSLDAAYEAVKSLNQALSENRLESKKIFEERLAIASPRFPVVTSPKNGQLKNIDDEIKSNEISERDCRYDVHGNLGVNSRLNKEVTSANGQAAQAQYDGARNRGDNNEDDPKISFCRTVSDAHVYHQPTKQPPSTRSSVYVEDEHSYAVNENGDSDYSESSSSDNGHNEERNNSINSDGRKVCSLPPGAATAIPIPWRAVWLQDPGVDEFEKMRNDETSDVDLSIVKTEWPEGSNEISNPIEEQASNVAVMPTVTRHRSFAYPMKYPVRRTRRNDYLSTEAQLLRKRKQTRERMRRWRAKKKMESELMMTSYEQNK